jgi:uncharacterized protein Usg
MMIRRYVWGLLIFCINIHFIWKNRQKTAKQPKETSIISFWEQALQGHLA